VQVVLQEELGRHVRADFEVAGGSGEAEEAAEGGGSEDEQASPARRSRREIVDDPVVQTAVRFFKGKISEIRE